MIRWQIPNNDDIPEIAKRMMDEYNILIAGTVGSGKSVLLHDFVYGLLSTRSPDVFVPNGAKLFLIDPKMVELWQYRNLPHTMGYASDPDEICRLLDRVTDLMNERYEVMRDQGLKKYGGSDVYVLIDETSDLMVSHIARKFESKLVKLAQLSRAAKIHIIACTQSPSRKTITANMKVCFTACIGLHCSSAIESRQIVDVTGCECLPMYGYGKYKSPEGVVSITIPMVAEQSVRAAIENWEIQSREANFKRFYYA